mgnify:CR=1 FL=1
MKTYVLVYEGFVQFEVVLTNCFMQSVSDIITVGIDKETVISHEGFKTVPHITLDEVNIDDVDLFVIPGGEPEQLFGVDGLYNLIRNLDKEGKVIGGICASPIHLAKAGVLENREFTTTLPVEEFNVFDGCNYVDDDLVIIDDNIITAKARGYVDFALEIGRVMNIYKDEADYKETINYFKYYKIK